MDIGILKDIIKWVLAACFIAILLLGIAVYAYQALKVLYYIVLGIFYLMKYIIKSIISYLKSKWPQIKEALIIIFCTGMFILWLFFSCFKEDKPRRHYNQEEIEEILDDPMWNVPSRYR